MSIFRRTEDAKKKQLSKILGLTGNADKKTLDQLESEIIKDIQEEQGTSNEGMTLGSLTTYSRKDKRRLGNEAYQDQVANDNTLLDTPTQQNQPIQTSRSTTIALGEEEIPFLSPLRTEKFKRREVQTIDPINRERLANINIDSPQMSTEIERSEGLNFNDYAGVDLTPQEEVRKLLIESVGEKPELNEDALKRARTQSLINAFGNLLQAGVGFGTMQSGGFFQARPIDNSQVLANLEGVYDNYYKELADYRNRQRDTRLKLAQLDAGEIQADTQRALDEEKERVRVEEREADILRKEKETIEDRDFRKELAELEIEARNKIQNARTDDERRKFINDGMRNLNTQYANIFDRYQEINDQLSDLKLDESERTKLIEEGNKIVEELNAINENINTFRDYSDQLIRTGTINFDKQDEVNTPVVSDTAVETGTGQTPSTPTQTTVTEEQKIQANTIKAREEIEKILVEELNLNGEGNELPKVDTSSIDSLKNLLDVINNAKSSRDKINLFGMEDLYVGGKYKSIDKLKNRITSLIKRLESQGNQS